jgi:serine/threonine-protein kinase RsbW
MSRTLQEEIEKQVSIASELLNVSVLEELILDICGKLNGQSLFCGRVLVSVKEAFVNAVIHGNRGDKSKYVTVTFRVSKSGCLEVEIADDGAGFNYMELWSPFSRANESNDFFNASGLFLMKVLSDSLSFNEKGNKVKMLFRCRS